MTRYYDALKALDTGSVLKSISTIKKYLIDAQKATILTVDDIEDNSYKDMSLPVEDAVKISQAIQAHIVKAIELSERLKSIVRNNPGDNFDYIDAIPNKKLRMR